MGSYVASQLVKELLRRRVNIKVRTLILRLTFKENCPDLRNTGVVDVINELKSFGLHVDVFDPWADKSHRARIQHYPNHNPKVIIMMQ